MMRRILFKIFLCFVLFVITEVTTTSSLFSTETVKYPEYGQAGQIEVTGNFSSNLSQFNASYFVGVQTNYFIWDNWALTTSLGNQFHAYLGFWSFDVSSTVGFLYLITLPKKFSIAINPYTSIWVYKYYDENPPESLPNRYNKWLYGAYLTTDFIIKYHFDEFLLNLTIEPSYHCNLRQFTCGANYGYFSTTIGFSVLF